MADKICGPATFYQWSAHGWDSASTLAGILFAALIVNVITHALARWRA